VLEEVAYLNNEILRYEENPFDIMVTMRLFPLLIHMRATVHCSSAQVMCSRIRLKQLGYNYSTPITALFRRSRQNSYLLRAIQFGYNDFGYIVTSPTATLSVRL